MDKGNSRVGAYRAYGGYIHAPNVLWPNVQRVSFELQIEGVDNPDGFLLSQRMNEFVLQIGQWETLDDFFLNVGEEVCVVRD